MFTALDINTNETVTVQPIAVYGSDAFDTLLIVDAITGNGIWMGADSSPNGLSTWDAPTPTPMPRGSKMYTAMTRTNGRPQRTGGLPHMVSD